MPQSIFEVHELFFVRWDEHFLQLLHSNGSAVFHLVKTRKPKTPEFLMCTCKHPSGTPASFPYIMREDVRYTFEIFLNFPSIISGYEQK